MDESMYEGSVKGKRLGGRGAEGYSRRVQGDEALEKQHD